MAKNFPDNRELIFGYAGILGTVITVVYTAYAAYHAALSFDFSATVITLCLVNAFLVLSSSATLRRYFALQRVHNPLVHQVDNLKSFQITISKVMHNINHQARTLINKLNNDILLSDVSREREMGLSFEKYLIFLLDNIKEIFDVVTDDQCSVCIKLLVPNKENPEQTFVKTHYRDSISFRERRKSDFALKDYPYYENTAFKKIIRKEYKNRIYFCNNLKEEHSYTNLNTEWQEYYNATLVVPISLPVDGSSQSQSSVIIGFLCVDNMKGNFDEKITRNILSSIADLTFLIYKSFNDYKSFTEKKIKNDQQ